MKRRYTELISLALRKQDYDLIKILADKKEISLAQFVRDILADTVLCTTVAS